MNEYDIVNPLYLNYIPDDKKEQYHYNLTVDVFYFYNGYKPSEKQRIVYIDGNIFNLSKKNLKLLSNPLIIF
jgi:hypothetical protein